VSKHNRKVIAILALIGFFVAFYLYAHVSGMAGPLQCGVGDCQAVQASNFAKVGPVPVSLIGVIGYAFLLALSLLGQLERWSDSRRLAAVLFLGATGGWLFSAYLTYVEAWVINAWCQYCVASAVVMTLIMVMSIPEARRAFTSVQDPTEEQPAG